MTHPKGKEAADSQQPHPEGPRRRHGNLRFEYLITCWLFQRAFLCHYMVSQEQSDLSDCQRWYF